jgi:hypothetical protein
VSVRVKGLSLSLCIKHSSAMKYGHRGYETPTSNRHRKPAFQKGPTTGCEDVDHSQHFLVDCQLFAV